MAARKKTKTVADYPDKAKFWHPTKNEGLKPEDVAHKSHTKRWWVCEKGHEKFSSPAKFLLANWVAWCAECRSLAHLHPDLAAQWHPTKNGDLKPKDITSGSGKKVWWKCPEGPDHEWAAITLSRTSGRGQCPFCVGHKISSTNNLAHLRPDLAAQWHPTKNGGLKPGEVTTGSSKKVWWKCFENSNHDWQTEIRHRTTRENDCPFCAQPTGVRSLRVFVLDLIPHLGSFSPARLYYLFMWGGFLKQGKTGKIAKAILAGKLPVEEIEKFANEENSELDFEEDSESPEEGFEEEGFEEEGFYPDPQPLPNASSKKVLSAVDSLATLIPDEEARVYFTRAALVDIWSHAFRDEAQAVLENEEFQGGEYAEQVRKEFLDEYRKVKAFETPDGYDFRDENRNLLEPNLMQRLVVVRILEQRVFLNLSGTGSGKTLAAILAMRETGSRLSVILCPNATVTNVWATEIKRVFPDSQVQCKTWSPVWDGTNPRYLILNFEMLQQGNSERDLKLFLEREQIDFLTIDEIHSTKQRAKEKFSKRRRLVLACRAEAHKRNPDLYVLGMSATPVVNNLREGISLLEIVTGLDHSDMGTEATISNGLALHSKFVVHGIRYVPDYAAALTIRHVEVDCGDYVEDIRQLGKDPTPFAVEQVLTKARLPTILDQLKPGDPTLVYTRYIKGIDKVLYDAIKAKGLRVGLYTGKDKSGLQPFLDGELDVLIGTSTLSTGLDGLQRICSKIVVNMLPWTCAEFTQLKGRVHRQGQQSARVEIIIPQTYANINGEHWSYCSPQWERILYKRTIGDLAVDGAVPPSGSISQLEAHRAALALLGRLSVSGNPEITRKRLTVDLGDSGSVLAEKGKRFGDFSRMNSRWNRSKSQTLVKRLAEDPDEWRVYHDLYRKARQTWTVVPVEETIRWASKRKGYTIGDFGCGEAEFAETLSSQHTIHSFDHVAINGKVRAGDMASTGLENGSLDVAIFSLSLMGQNFSDYLVEANRVLRLDGTLLIWEATSRFDDVERFARDLERLGFDVLAPKQVGKFVRIQAVKCGDPREGAGLVFKLAKDRETLPLPDPS